MIVHSIMCKSTHSNNYSGPCITTPYTQQGVGRVVALSVSMSACMCIGTKIASNVAANSMRGKCSTEHFLF